jgi:ribosome-binding protein aMBF1 (putative translation factor)
MESDWQVVEKKQRTSKKNTLNDISQKTSNVNVFKSIAQNTNTNNRNNASYYVHNDANKDEDKKYHSNKKNETILSSRQANDFDPETVKAPTISSKDLANAIQAGRQAKNLKQSDLDKLCNFPLNTTRDYESCKAVVNPNQLNTYNRVLDVKLPRPNKK